MSEHRCSSSRTSSAAPPSEKTVKSASRISRSTPDERAFQSQRDLELEELHSLFRECKHDAAAIISRLEVGARCLPLPCHWNSSLPLLFPHLQHVLDEVPVSLNRIQGGKYECSVYVIASMNAGCVQNEKTQLMQQLVTARQDVERLQEEMAALRALPACLLKPVSDQHPQVRNAQAALHGPGTSQLTEHSSPSRLQSSQLMERISPARPQLSSVVYMLPRPPPAARKTGMRHPKP